MLGGDLERAPERSIRARREISADQESFEPGLARRRACAGRAPERLPGKFRVVSHQIASKKASVGFFNGPSA
jgi:hypothetical protein